MAVYWRMALTAFAVSVGFQGDDAAKYGVRGPAPAARLASSMSATTPDTTAVDMLVPLSLMYRAPTRSSGYSAYSEPSSAASETRLSPGATTSGFAIASNHDG